jgi:long-chain acyl-CoA synthetase
MNDHVEASEQGARDTFPKILLDLAAHRADKVAIREKFLGIWQSHTWAQSLDNVRDLALGLAAHGFARGDKIAIIGDNRPHLYWAVAAAQALGGVPVPIYQDSIVEEMEYVLEHAGVRFVVAEDQEQVDKVLAVRDKVPGIELIVYKDPRGMRHYREPGLEWYEDIQKRGRDFHADKPDYFTDEVAKGRGADLGVMLYTSGTTGRPKGVMLSYDNVIFAAGVGIRHDRLTENEEVVAYLPMAWVGDHLFSYGEALCAGFTVNCPESGETVLQDLREIGPTYYFAPPRVWENILTTVMVRIEDAARVKRWLFHKFMKVAERVGERIMDGRTVGIGDRLLYGLGEILIYGPLKDNLGMSRIRVAYTAGEALGPETFSFYRSLGINIKQVYGMTEATVFVTGQSDGDVRNDTVGGALPGVEIKIGDGGEVMFRSAGMFMGYYKNDEATAEATTEDGWVHTGDAGLIDGDGHLKIIDRAKDVGALTDGTMFAPKYIENKLKFSPFVREAVAHGDARDHVTAFVNIDLDAVGNWAERRSIAYTSYTDLAARPEVYGLIREEVERVNRSLAEDDGLAGAQIRRFLILHKELDPDDNELTRTRKVRRAFVADKYKALIDGLYSDASAVDIEAEVTYEDGRKGTLKATLTIEDVTVTAPTAKAA